MVEVDLIIIGAGPGGYEVAAEESAHGKQVVIIEKDRLGGTCLNRGCIPTKCLCASADTIHTVQSAPMLGVSADLKATSYRHAHDRAFNIVATLREGIEGMLGKCHVVKGEAVITAHGTVRVEGGEEFTAPKVIIATGSCPSVLPIPGAEHALTSDAFFMADKLPESLTIIGGGVIGVEFAYIARAFGVDVTVVEYCKEILPPFETEVAKRLRLKLAESGIKFMTSCKVTEINAYGNDFKVSFTDRKGENDSLVTGAVIMAVGRRAVLPPGLKEAGIDVDERGFICTDEKMQTTRPGFYAVGDCNGRMMLAHVATAQSMVAVGRDVNLKVVPSAVFVQPEVAMVGLTTEQCKAAGIPYESHKALYRANGKALASGHEDGFVKVLVCPETNHILGCHILGAHASDLIQEATLAMSAGLTVEQVAVRTIHGHPTLSELMAAALA